MKASDTSAHGPSPEPLLLLCRTPPGTTYFIGSSLGGSTKFFNISRIPSRQL